MKLFRIVGGVWAVVAVIGLAGCSGSGSDSAAKDDGAKKGAAQTELALPADVEFAEVTLEGKLGCGHCTFQATDGCALAMKTDEGDVVVIETTAEKHDEMFAERMAQKPVYVEGKMGEVGGQLVVYTDRLQYR